MIDIEETIKMVKQMAKNVRRQLGPGYLEAVYKNAMVIELRKAGLHYRAEYPIEVRYDGFVVGAYKADIIVEDCLILELKAVQAYSVAHEVQLVNYLTSTGIDHGLLINFGADQLEFSRKYRIYHKPFR